MGVPANFELDAIDLKILEELQADARLPNLALADRVGLSPSPCSRRVKLLEEAGVIEGYRAALNRKAIGLGLTVFAGVRVDRHSLENADAFVNAILAMPEVVVCHLVSGDADFLIEATVLRRLLALPALRDIRSSFAMRSFKAGGGVAGEEARGALNGPRATGRLAVAYAGLGIARK